MTKIDEARAAIATAQQRLDEAKEFLKRAQRPALDPRDYIVGFFDDLNQLREVWKVFKNYDCDLIREDFTYQSVTDYDRALYRGGYWSHGSNAGLFYAIMYDEESNVITDVGFRCAAGHKTISVAKFLEMFEEEM